MVHNVLIELGVCLCVRMHVVVCVKLYLCCVVVNGLNGAILKFVVLLQAHNRFI